LWNAVQAQVDPSTDVVQEEGDPQLPLAAGEDVLGPVHEAVAPTLVEPADVGRPPQCEEDPEQVAADPVEVEVVGAPAVDPPGDRRRVGEDRRDLLPVDAAEQEPGAAGCLVDVLLGDDAQRQQQRVDAGKLAGEVVHQQQLEQALADLGEELGRVHAVGCRTQTVDVLVDRLGLVQQGQHLSRLGAGPEAVERRHGRVHLGRERGVLRRQGRHVPAEPVEQGPERRQVGHGLGQGLHGQDQVARERVEGPGLGAGLH
jgi:hypothetical protein